MVIFIWVYYSAQIFLMGAEFTWVYARTFGSMRSLSESAKEARDADLPSRSEETPAPAGAAAGGGAGAAADRARGRGGRRAGWRNVGIGLAAGLALRYIVPRLLRRR